MPKGAPQASTNVRKEESSCESWVSVLVNRHPPMLSSMPSFLSVSDAPVPGWWQASDGRWYPPEAASPAPPEADWPGHTASVEGAYPASSFSTPWGLGEILVLVLLIGSSLRLAGALVGAAIGWNALSNSTHGQQLGNALIWAGDFADGQGILLLLVSFALISWNVQRPWPIQAPSSEVTRTRRLLVWLASLFIVSVVGAAVYAVGNAFFYAGVGTTHEVWQHFVGTGAFYFAYGLIALGGSYVSIRLLRENPKVAWTNHGDPWGPAPTGISVPR
jgi:hypothetical protein